MSKELNIDYLVSLIEFIVDNKENVRMEILFKEGRVARIDKTIRVRTTE